MKQDKSWLSVDFSPNELNQSGVRRVNQLPLLIALSVLVLFVMIITFVAVKRAGLQNESQAIPQSKVEPKDSLRLAKEIIGERGNGLIPSASTTKRVTETIILPVAVTENSELPPMPPRIKAEDESLIAEKERIRQEKIQQFEEAVKAKTGIEIQSMVNQRPAHQRINGSESVVLASRQALDLSAQFKARLQEIQGSSNGQSNQGVSTQTLGGQENENRWLLNAELETPSTPYMIRTGAVIPGLMISGIRSDLPGSITGQVSQNVYDTATGKYLLIPQGTKLLGLYASDVSYGQDSLLIAWQRLVFPDGRALDLGSMPGVNEMGMAGFPDKVNNHYFRLFGSALLMSGIVAGVSYSQNQNAGNGPYAQPTFSGTLSQALGQQLGEVTAQMVAKNLNRAPTLEIGSAYRFNVTVVKDLVFKKPYRAFDY